MQFVLAVCPAQMTNNVDNREDDPLWLTMTYNVRQYKCQAIPMLDNTIVRQCKWETMQITDNAKTDNANNDINDNDRQC